MATEKYSVQINAPLEHVYALYTNLENLPRWFPHVRAVKNATASMTTPGARFTIRFDGKLDAFEEVLEVIPNVLHSRKFVQARGGMGAWGHAIIRFRAVPGGTEVEEEVEFGFLPGFLAPLMSVLLDRQARASIRSELNSFKTFAERKANPNSTLESSGRVSASITNLNAHA
jgi:uncharacterized membrane protein